jgi:hypothetical protein
LSHYARLLPWLFSRQGLAFMQELSRPIILLFVLPQVTGVPASHWLRWGISTFWWKQAWNHNSLNFPLPNS